DLKQELGQLCGAVWRSLGQHQTERAYQPALCMEQVRRGVTVEAEAEIPTTQYRGEYVGWRRLDVLLRVAGGSECSYASQIKHYLDISGISHGFLVNFPRDAGFPPP
ncbi:unnamed protein product, partial [Ectocarpus sp. 12 AP-2014]